MDKGVKLAVERKVAKVAPTKQLSKKELKKLADEEFERELAASLTAVGALQCPKWP